MEYTLKISNKGIDVRTGSGETSTNKVREDINGHILTVFALPYVVGAILQVERYRAAVNKPLAHGEINAVYYCIHEISSLFEDLTTVSKYMIKAGLDHSLHSKWVVLRNHFRHDFRENFDKEGEKLKTQRERELGVASGMQTDIVFKAESVKVGATIITLEEVVEYCNWAMGKCKQSTEEAETKGLITTA